MWFIGVEVEQETSAPPSKKNPGSAPASFPAQTQSFLWGKFFTARLEVLPNLRQAGASIFSSTPQDLCNEPKVPRSSPAHLLSFCLFFPFLFVWSFFAYSFCWFSINI